MPENLHMMGPIIPLSDKAMAADSTIRVPWTTDRAEHGELGKYGPDGPWQALAITIGDEEPNEHAFQPMWPSLHWITRVLTFDAGSYYVLTNSSTFGEREYEGSDWSFQGSSNLDGIINGEEESGDVVFDDVHLRGIYANFRSSVNATIFALSSWDYNVPKALPSGSHNYPAKVGSLGLGLPTPRAGEDTQISGPLPAPILRLLRKQGIILSETFSAHIGSAELSQPGSLILGGYEQHRVLGPVGVFDFDPLAVSSDRKNLEIVDIHLGTQIGGSPFTNGKKDEGSIWPALPSFVRSISAEVSFELPYLYLPRQTCQALAERLHLLWESKLELFLWDTSDPNLQRVVSSPAYLAIVFRDRRDANLTIKVPLRLLYLTLEPPLVTESTRYFPCRPVAMVPYISETFGILGRAFLQAAFFAADFEYNLTYLAQAPGPDMDHSSDITISFLSSDDKVRAAGNITVTNPIEEFQKTWLSSWAVLADDVGATEIDIGEDTSNGTSGNGNDGIPTASVIGVSVGVLAAMGLAIAAWMWYNYRRPSCMQKRNGKTTSKGSSQGKRGQFLAGLQSLGRTTNWVKRKIVSGLKRNREIELTELGAEKDVAFQEMATDTRPEIGGASIVIHEAPEEGVVAYAELPERRFSTATTAGVPDKTRTFTPDGPQTADSTADTGIDEGGESLPVSVSVSEG
ncbi:Aspartic peptidase domain containing protein [Rhypophila sp. PSN 637]